MINLTNSAAAKIKTLMDEEAQDTQLGKTAALRVAVRPGGCSGFSYELFFDDATNEDLTAEINGVPVAIDAQSYSYLKGATLDYKETLMGGGFLWENPNVQRSCGCGQSFS